MTKDRAPPPSITKMIESMAHRHAAHTVFSDFVEMAAISISNTVDLRNRDQRESRYMEIAKRYERHEMEKFPDMLGALTLALEDGFSDVLGRSFHELNLQNKWTGQCFSPYPVCQMMAQMTMGDDHRAIIEERGFIRASEPCVGSGAMVIALAEALKNYGINYQQHLHVTAVDVDLKCLHMSYLQFSLLNIPATIVHGNTITLEEWDIWKTPAHIMGAWDWKLRNSRKSQVQGSPDHPAAPHPERPTTSEVIIQPVVPPSQLTLF